MAERGCGSRKEGGVYMVVPTSPFGLPLESFLIDYPVPWTGGTLRSPMIVTDKEGVGHVLLGCGAENYAAVSDFVEEARFMGVSKRVPMHFAERDLRRLTPGKSSLTLIHPRAIPLFKFEAEYECPKVKQIGAMMSTVARSKQVQKMTSRDVVHADLDPKCIGGLWPLSAFSMGKKHRVMEDGPGAWVVRTPSVSYRVSEPAWPKPVVELDNAREPPEHFLESKHWQAGLFLRFPVFNFEFIGKKGEAPKALADACSKAGFGLEVLPE